MVPGLETAKKVFTGFRISATTAYKLAKAFPTPVALFPQGPHQQFAVL